VYDENPDFFDAIIDPLDIRPEVGFPKALSWFLALENSARRDREAQLRLSNLVMQHELGNSYRIIESFSEELSELEEHLPDTAMVRHAISGRPFWRTTPARDYLRDNLRSLNEHLQQMHELTGIMRGDEVALDRKIDLSEVVAESTRRQEDHGSGTQIRTDLTSRPLPVATTQSGILLPQLIRNVVGNSLQHAPGSTITLSTWLDEGERRAWFGCQDSGSGYPTEALPTLFTPLQDQTGRIKLGLYMCWKYAALHGGGCTAGNTEGGGASFRLWLPLVEEVSIDERTPRLNRR